MFKEIEQKRTNPSQDHLSTPRKASEKKREKEEGDYQTALDCLTAALDQDYEARVKGISSTLVETLSENSKIMRYVLKDMFREPRWEQRALTVDALWKYMLVLVDTLMEFERRKIVQCATSAKKENETNLLGLGKKLDLVKQSYKQKEREFVENEKRYVRQINELRARKVRFGEIYRDNRRRWKRCLTQRTSRLRSCSILTVSSLSTTSCPSLSTSWQKPTKISCAD